MYNAVINKEAKKSPPKISGDFKAILNEQYYLTTSALPTANLFPFTSTTSIR